MKNYSIPFLCVLLACVFSIGCGSGHVGVSGKVTFPDGSPLTKGEVTFQQGTFAASGKVQPDGTYTIGSLGVKDGLPKGEYVVTVKAIEYSSDTELSEDKAPVKNSARSLVDPKFFSPETSGLKCDVKGKTTYNIPVTAPE